MPTTRRTRGAVLAPARDDPMPRKPRSRATSVASSQRSNDDYQHNAPVAPLVISRLASHNDELSAENEDLRQELEKQKTKRWTLRDKRLAEQLKEYHAQHPAEPEQEQQKEPQPQTESTPARETTQVTPAKENTSQPSQSSALVRHSTQNNTPQAPNSVPRWRQLLTSLGGFSPFPARRVNTPRAEPVQVQSTSNDSPLGELPPNRKRPAPAEQEQETPTKRTKTPEPESAPQAASEHLETIAEQAELPAKEFAAQTPTRPSRNMAPPQQEQPQRGASTTPRRRTIRDVRAAQASRTPLPASGLRRWETPSKPREPNADKRLARMQELDKLREQKKQMESQIAKLAAEQEADGIDTRKRKRVKVDELAFIPHNNPGDAGGTFRVPDWDSDEEMEVDDEVPVRENLFSMNKATTAPAPFKPASTVQATSSVPFPPKPISAPAAARQQLPTSPVAEGLATKLDFMKPAPKQDLSKAQPSAVPPVRPEPVIEPVAPKPSMFGSAASKTNTASQANIFKSAPSALALAKAFDFPNVGAKQVDEWPAAQRIAAGEKFARGFNAWLAVGLTA